jgi:L-rhamnonate dehydratase
MPPGKIAPAGSTADGEEAYGIKYLGIVKIETDAGITGYADLETQPHVAKAIVDAPSEGAVPGFQGLRSVLLGEDPFEVERLWHKMYMASVYYGRRGAAMQVISGIDIALWDIVGKRVGQPIYKLLGAGYRDRVRAYASTLFRSTPDGMREAPFFITLAGFQSFVLHLF